MRTFNRPDRAAREALRDTPNLTLDGKPANLININGQKPIVHAGTHHVEVEWSKAQYVIANAGGRFKS